MSTHQVDIIRSLPQTQPPFQKEYDKRMRSFEQDFQDKNSGRESRLINLSQASQESYVVYNNEGQSVKSQYEAKHEELGSNNKEEHMMDEQKPQERRSASSAGSGVSQLVYVKQQKQQDITLGMTVIDLNRYLFNGIVELCRRQRLIGEDVAHSFLTNHSVGVDKKYIQLFKTGQLQYFDFQKCKINLIDHRRLTQMLVAHNPDKYVAINKPQNPYDFVKETQQFLKDIYSMSASDYRRELEEQVIKYCQIWWGGPQKLSPVVDPPIKFYQTQEGQRTRIQRETAIVVQTPEEEKERNKRINTQRTTSQDLKDIAKNLSHKLYGQRIKIQNESEADSKANPSIADESPSEVNGANGGAHATKHKKQKKIKKDKKEKKDKGKKKQKKKDKKHKKQKSSKSRRDPPTPKREEPDQDGQAKPSNKK